MILFCVLPNTKTYVPWDPLSRWPILQLWTMPMVKSWEGFVGAYVILGLALLRGKKLPIKKGEKKKSNTVLLSSLYMNDKILKESKPIWDALY